MRFIHGELEKALNQIHFHSPSSHQGGQRPHSMDNQEDKFVHLTSLGTTGMQHIYCSYH